MVTRAFVRLPREGKFENIEFDQLTDAELDTFAEDFPEDGWKWAKFFSRWIRDNIQVDPDPREINAMQSQSV